MLYPPILVNPSVNFWSETINALFEEKHLFGEIMSKGSHDFSEWQVIVPNSIHIMYWRSAFLEKFKKNVPTSLAFILPQVNTQLNWLAIWIPLQEMVQHKRLARFIHLYSELHEHQQFRKLFSNHWNTSLLSLVQTLLSLSTELVHAVLPTMQNAVKAVNIQWNSILAQLSPLVRNILSEEIQFFRLIFKKEFMKNKFLIKCFSNILATATIPIPPLIWISSIKPDAMENLFLSLYSKYAKVQPIVLNWYSSSVPALYQKIWPEMVDISESSILTAKIEDILAISQLIVKKVKLSSANSLENVATQGAQIILDWLQEGKTKIAIVVQDYMSARRLSTLLERAKVLVADEIGQKLSTTQAATTLMAWCDVISEQSNIITLLNFLKLPFVLACITNKINFITSIEFQLRQQNIFGVWRDNIFSCLDIPQNIYNFFEKLALQTVICNTSKTFFAWSLCIRTQLDILGIFETLKQDIAGQEILLLLESLGAHAINNDVNQMFSFSEWRAFLDFQLKTIVFLPLVTDYRVVMLSLNNISLRSFDAVLLLGADAEHLPAQSQETLFFSNAMRHKFGLSTRASRQCQVLRDLTELFCSNAEIVLSWQTHKVNGEQNLFSPILERLQLHLAKMKIQLLLERKCTLPTRHLFTSLPAMPAPIAPELLPTKLSITQYNSLMSCPYQFFVLYMLQVVPMKKFLYVPKKYHYSLWLHKILAKYHSILRNQHICLEKRQNLLKQISDTILNTVIVKYPTILNYITRWHKTIPAYLSWANKHEQEGWYFVFSEIVTQKTLTWSGGESIELYGRLDRIDQNNIGERIVLDYKVQNLPALITRLKEFKEDYQLVFYGLLSQQNLSMAHYVALEMHKAQIGSATVSDFTKQQEKLQQQISAIVTAIKQGTPLPANGIKSVCRYCEIRGLCRKGMW